MAAPDRRSERWPALVVFGSAAFWGLYWLPQRELAEAGLAGGWATFAQFALAAVLIGPAIVWRIVRRRPSGYGPPLACLCIGGGLALYANSLLFTTVAHALLLFYLAPVWGTLLDVVVARRGLSLPRVVAVVMSLGGLWVVVGLDAGVPWPTALGDWLGLAAGMALMYGQFRLRARPGGDDLGTLFAMLVGGSVVAALFVAIGGDASGPRPGPGDIVAALPWLVAVTVTFQVIGNVGLMWGAPRLDSGPYAILILSDVVVGVATAAAFAGEPFGWREAVGWVLIVGAGLVEVVVPSRRRVA
ncbi:MAG: DMT family transporter [Alphaproteobacteria bacterium]